VREHAAMQQRERGSGAVLAVGDARAVMVVVETQSHAPYRTSGAHLEWAAR